MKIKFLLILVFLILKVVQTYKSDFLITVDGKEIFVRFLIQGKGAKRVVSA